MSHQDLIAALQTQGEAKTAEMRLQAEEEAATLAADAKEQLDALEEEENRGRLAERDRLAAAIAAQAKLEARRLLAAARCRLAERLAALAKSCLSNLRDQEYEVIFARLAGEILPETWRQVRVSPADTALARKYFPNTPVVEDEAIIGGFELISDDGLLRIANTLGKRMERSWPALLPKIVGQVEREAKPR